MAAKKRKPAITGMARPEGLLDDVLGKLGKSAVGGVRRDVRASIKRGRTVDRMFGDRVPEKFSPRETRVTLRDKKAFEDAQRSYFSARGRAAGMSQKEIDKMTSGQYFRDVPREYHNEFAKIVPEERATLDRRRRAKDVRIFNELRAANVARQKVAKKAAKKATPRKRVR